MIESYTKCHLQVAGAEMIRSLEDLRNYIRCFEPEDGWIAYQSAVARWEASVDPDRGTMLDAELCKENATLIIRRSAGGWIATELTEREGEPCHYDSQYYVSVSHGLMEYRRYWRETGEGIAPFAYRLVRFCQVPEPAVIMEG